MGQPLSCDDGDACTTDSCSTATGCTHAPLGTPECTPRTGTPGKACSDEGELVTLDACGAVVDTESCDDDDPGTEDACDPDALECTHTLVVVDGTDTTDGSEATDATDGLDATDAADAADASDVTDATDATDGSDMADGSDAVDVTDGVDASEVTDGTDAADAIDAVDAADGGDGSPGPDAGPSNDVSGGDDGGDAAPSCAAGARGLSGWPLVFALVLLAAWRRRRAG